MLDEGSKTNLRLLAHVTYWGLQPSGPRCSLASRHKSSQPHIHTCRLLGSPGHAGDPVKFKCVFFLSERKPQTFYQTLKTEQKQNKKQREMEGMRRRRTTKGQTFQLSKILCCWHSSLKIQAWPPDATRAVKTTQLILSQHFGWTVFTQITHRPKPTPLSSQSSIT